MIFQCNPVQDDIIVYLLPVETNLIFSLYQIITLHKIAPKSLWSRHHNEINRPNKIIDFWALFLASLSLRINISDNSLSIAIHWFNSPPTTQEKHNNFHNNSVDPFNYTNSFSMHFHMPNNSHCIVLIILFTCCSKVQCQMQST